MIFIANLVWFTDISAQNFYKQKERFEVIIHKTYQMIILQS